MQIKSKAMTPLFLIILAVIFLACVPNHEKHPGAAAVAEYGWIVVGILLIGLAGAVLRGCASGF